MSNWLTDYVRPKIRALVSRETTLPDDLWRQCTSCERMIFHRDFEQAQRVCPHCGHHMRVDPKFRFETLFDADSWQQIELPKVPADPLKFRDQKKYADRLKETQAKTTRQDALEAAHGKIDGMPAVIAVMNFAFMGGSMGTAVGEAFLAAAKLAVLQEAAFIVFTSSGGARMQEGALSLMQMARTTVAVEMVKDKRLPYIVVLTDPTTGGVTASFAMLGDVQMAEPGAMIGFAGARVIEQTIREKLPEGFQRAEYLRDHGIVDMVVHRFDLRATLVRVLDLLLRKRRETKNGPAVEPVVTVGEAPTLELVKASEQPVE